MPACCCCASRPGNNRPRNTGWPCTTWVERVELVVSSHLKNVKVNWNHHPKHGWTWKKMCENTNQKMNMVGYVTDIDRLPKMSNAANLVSTIMGHAPTHERSRKAYPAKTAENWAPHLYAGRNHFWHVHELSIYIYICQFSRGGPLHRSISQDSQSPTMERLKLCSTLMVPSGNLTVCYWKWPSRNNWFTKFTH